MALDQHAVFDKAGDRLAHGDARKRELPAQFALAWKRMTGSQSSGLNRQLDRPAQTRIGVWLARRRAAGEVAIFLGDRWLHTTIIPETYQLGATTRIWYPRLSFLLRLAVSCANWYFTGI